MRQMILCVALAPACPVIGGCRDRCDSDAQCADGRVCMHIAPGPDDGSNDCVRPCSAWGADHECGGAQCYCPDSPAGIRCQRVPKPLRNPDGGAVSAYFCAGSGYAW